MRINPDVFLLDESALVEMMEDRGIDAVLAEFCKAPQIQFVANTDFFAVRPQHLAAEIFKTWGQDIFFSGQYLQAEVEFTIAVRHILASGRYALVQASGQSEMTRPDGKRVHADILSQCRMASDSWWHLHKEDCMNDCVLHGDCISTGSEVVVGQPRPEVMLYPEQIDVRTSGGGAVGRRRRRRNSSAVVAIKKALENENARLAEGTERHGVQNNTKLKNNSNFGNT